jgi:TPR repeat protein
MFEQRESVDVLLKAADLGWFPTFISFLWCLYSCAYNTLSTVIIGDIRACWYAGGFYSNGVPDVLERDLSKAQIYWRRAANGGE